MSTFTTTLPAPFTRELPENAPNRNDPDWVACRFDGVPDFRADLSIAGLRVVSKWPGEWAWCEDTDLRALILGQPAQGATGDSEVVRLRDIAGHAITVMRAWSMNDKSKSEARQAAADDLWAKLHPDSLKITPGEIISAPGGPFELEKGETPHAP